MLHEAFCPEHPRRILAVSRFKTEKFDKRRRLFPHSPFEAEKCWGSPSSVGPPQRDGQRFRLPVYVPWLYQAYVGVGCNRLCSAATKSGRSIRFRVKKKGESSKANWGSSLLANFHTAVHRHESYIPWRHATSSWHAFETIDGFFILQEQLH